LWIGCSFVDFHGKIIFWNLGCVPSFSVCMLFRSEWFGFLCLRRMFLTGRLIYFFCRSRRHRAELFPVTGLSSARCFSVATALVLFFSWSGGFCSPQVGCAGSWLTRSRFLGFVYQPRAKGSIPGSPRIFRPCAPIFSIAQIWSLLR
jgi:hypothetical protein